MPRKKGAVLKPREVYCSKEDCRKLGSTTVRMWGKDYGPYCLPHAEEVSAEMEAFDQHIDSITEKSLA